MLLHVTHYKTVMHPQHCSPRESWSYFLEIILLFFPSNICSGNTVHSARQCIYFTKNRGRRQRLLNVKAQGTVSLLWLFALHSGLKSIQQSLAWQFRNLVIVTEAKNSVLLTLSSLMWLNAPLACAEQHKHLQRKPYTCVAYVHYLPCKPEAQQCLILAYTTAKVSWSLF